MIKVAIMGAGAIGGYFGARLAKAGYHVDFIARGPHLHAISKKGLRIESPLGNIQLPKGSVYKSSKEVGVVDIVIFAVKLSDMSIAAKACRPMLGDDTAVIPFLNGVEAPLVLASFLGKHHACGGAAYISAHISEPGVVRHNGNFARLIFGETNGDHTPRLKKFQNACIDSGVEAAISDNIEVTMWEKFIFLVAMAGMTAAARAPIGLIRDDPSRNEVLTSAMNEVIAVGLARGIPLPKGLLERQSLLIKELPYEMKSSMLVDLELKKPLEAPWLSGAVSRMGRELGVKTPVNDVLFATLQPFIEGGNNTTVG